MIAPNFSSRLRSTDGRYLIPIYSDVLSSDTAMHEGRGSERAYDLTAHNLRKEIYPIADGVVWHIQRQAKRPNDGGYGVNLIIKHADIYCWYCHLELDSIRSDIQIGTALRQDEPFARVGNTGQTSFWHHTHITLFRGEFRTGGGFYTRVRPETIWPKEQLFWFPYATSAQLDKYSVGGSVSNREGINTIMGVFYQGRGGNTFDVLKTLKPAVVKVMHGKQEEFDIIRRNSPASVVWARIFEDDSKVSADIQRDPEGTAQYHHGLIVANKWKGVDLYQIQNEQNQHPPELQLLTRYYVRLINLAQQAGYKVTVGDFSVGNLHVAKNHPGDWEYFFPALELAQKYGMPINAHQYSKYSFWDDRYPTDWYIHRLEQTAMTVLDAAGFRKLTYVIGEFGLTNLLSNKVDPSDGKPGGWQKWRTHEEYLQDLKNIFDYLLQFSDRIIGYACYLTHPFSPWESHQMSRMNEDLANHYAANPQAVKALGSGKEVRPILFQARVVNTSELRVRTGPPDKDGLKPIIGKITDQDIIDVYDASALWWEIKHGDLEGWSHSGYLERIEEETTLELRVSALEDTAEIHTDTIARLEKVVAEQMVSIRMLDTRVAALEDGGGGNGGNGGSGDRRISEGAQFMGLTVLPPNGGAILYRLIDIFTTLNGSWEVGDQPPPYGIEQWARDAYLTSDFDDAGASTHLFAHILDRAGNPVGNHDVNYGTPDHEGNDNVQQTKARSGWANIALWPASSFSPENDERGVWAWGPPGGEIVMGGGLPNRLHVSTFGVWQEV